MSYEFKPRGKMFFGNVFDVYQDDQWIGSMTELLEEQGYMPTTPHGKWAGTMPFDADQREDAADWLAEQQDFVHRKERWKYDYLGSKIHRFLSKVFG